MARDRAWLTVPEAAKMLKVSCVAVRHNYIGKEQLEAEKVGGTWMIPRRALVAFMELKRPVGVAIDRR